MMELVHKPGDPVADVLFNWLPVLGTALAFAVGVYMLVLGFNTYAKAAILRKAGVKGRAVVTEKWVETGYADRKERHRTKPLKYHYLRFERRSGRRTYSEKEVAPLALWTEVEPGDEVDVIHLPRGALMRLAGWSHRIGHGAGLFQLTAGALLTAGAASMIIEGALAANAGPDWRDVDGDWVVERAEVLQIADPADPYLRLFAPSKTYIRVVFGDTQGRAWMANQRMILVSPEQLDGRDVSVGAILKAWMDPEDEYQAILDLERRRFAD